MPFYALGALVLMGVRARVRPNPPASASKIWHEVKAGMSYMRATSPLGLLFVGVTCHCSLTMATFGILPTIATANFGGAAGVYGLLHTAFGAGSILGPGRVVGVTVPA
jgi:hypothetical protein